MSTTIDKVSASQMAIFDSIFNADSLGGDLTDNVSGGMAVMSIRGGKFHIKFDGEETDVVDENGDARAAVEVVMLKANPHLQKTYYDGPYVQGSVEAPDCFSNDGVTPDASVITPQGVSCATCPKGQWGSRITEQGTKAKACGDSRRVAVVPVDDIANDAHGGAMLLRVPAASLKGLQQFGAKCSSGGYPYNALVTKLGFDPATSYPKLTFKAQRPLTDDEKGKVAKVWPTVDNVLEGAEPVSIASAPVTAAPPATELFSDNSAAGSDEAVEMEPVATAPAKVTKKKTTKKAAAKKAEAPVVDADADTNGALDDIMSEFNL